MSKAANIYWDSRTEKRSAARRPPTRTPKTRRAAKAHGTSKPMWMSFFIVGSIFIMLCVSINFRAFSEVREEIDQHQRLSTQIQSLTDENLQLQEDIHNLKSDTRVIQREAQRLGMALRQDKVPVPAN